MTLETVLPWNIIHNDQLAIKEAGTVEYFSVIFNDSVEQYLVLQNVDGKVSRFEYSEFIGTEIKRKQRLWVVVSNVKGRSPGWFMKRFAADRSKTNGEWWTANIDKAYIWTDYFMAQGYRKKLKFGEPEVLEYNTALETVDTIIESKWR